MKIVTNTERPILLAIFVHSREAVIEAIRSVASNITGGLVTLFTRIGDPTIVAVGCLCLAGAASSQMPAPTSVDRPTIKFGDSWTYNRIDGNTKAKQYTDVITVTSVDGKEMRTESRRADTGATIVTIRDLDLNRLVTDLPPGKATSSPHGAEYSWPLQVGKTWEQTVTTTRSNLPDWRTVAPLKAKVIGWEQITVPAGTFNALKIEINGLYDGLDPRGRWNGTIAETIWYVPELKNAARWTYQDNIRGRGDFNNDVWELVSYKPAL